MLLHYYAMFDDKKFNGSKFKNIHGYYELLLWPWPWTWKSNLFTQRPGIRQYIIKLCLAKDQQFIGCSKNCRIFILMSPHFDLDPEDNKLIGLTPQLIMLHHHTKFHKKKKSFSHSEDITVCLSFTLFTTTKSPLGYWWHTMKIHVSHIKKKMNV